MSPRSMSRRVGDDRCLPRLGVCSSSRRQANGLARTRRLLAKAVGLGADQEWGNRLRPPAGFVECHVQGVAHCDLAPQGALDPLSEDLDLCLDRAPSHERHFGPELDALADVDRLQKRHRVDRGRRDLPLARVPQGGDRSALVGQPQNDATVKRPIGIGLPRLGDDRQAHPRGRGRLGGDFLVRHEGVPPVFDRWMFDFRSHLRTA